MRRTRLAASLGVVGLAVGGWAAAQLPPPELPPTPAPRPTARTSTLTHPAGGYVREFVGGVRVSLWFADDRLTAELSPGKGDAGRVYLEADYAVNREGVVFGVVTAAEGADAGRLVGMPFAVRVRTDGGALVVREVRADPAADDATRELLAACLGRYTAASGGPPPRPAAKPTFPRKPTPTAPPVIAVPPPLELPALPRPNG